MVLLIVIVAVFVIVLAVNVSKAKQLARAKDAYQQNLAQLHDDPANATLKTETLRLGRVYSNLSRNSKGVAIFDEVALSNDLSAACAGVGASNALNFRSDPGERLKNLKAMLDADLISREEYEQKRAEIIGGI